MMASNLLSRFLPDNAVPSIYEDMRAEDEQNRKWDIEARNSGSIDEENLDAPLDDYLDNPDVFGHDSHLTTTESTAFLPTLRQGRPAVNNKGKGKMGTRAPRYEDEELGNDVPASLLIEDEDEAAPVLQRVQGISHNKPGGPPVPGPTSREARSKWETTRAQQPLHTRNAAGSHRVRPTLRTGVPLSDHEKAAWTWLNASNLDNFMHEVYDYYTGSGIYSICWGRLLNLLMVVFVAVFTTFLTQCVDYKSIPTSSKLSQILVPKCTNKISGFPNVLIWLLTLWVIWMCFVYIKDLSRLWRIHDFYLHLLNIPDKDLQTISWQDVVGRIMALRNSNPLTSSQPVAAKHQRFVGSQSKERLDAHDIANRLMRRENYLIALINKDILDLTLPIPFLRGRQIFSRTIMWALDFCIINYMFNDQGQVRQLVLKDTQRQHLSRGLRRRFAFAGFMNVIAAPFAISFIGITYFFKYFNEYQKNPSMISARQYTPLAEWKFREFNEVSHLFENRINMSYPFASRYIDQFPKVKTVQAARFVAFVAGAIVSILALATIIDPELFLAFEITHNRTVLFYLGVFGAIWAGARGAIPDDNLVFDPEYAIRNVIDYTHYMPKEWENKLHSDDVKRDFSTMYQMKVIVFAEEVLSLMLTPLILWVSLPQCSDRIVDFFREFTVHVDGLGYVCSFAVFDFKKGVGNAAATGGRGGGDALRDDYYSTKHGKMAASFYGFIDNYVTNPKTGIPGHVPPGMRHQTFHPPPSFPGLPTSPSNIADLQQSRMGRSGRATSRTTGGPSKTPRFGPAAAQPSPMASMLLDPHHQPSANILEKGRSLHMGRAARSRFLQEDIREVEEFDTGDYAPDRRSKDPSDPYSGLGESKWETSPNRETSNREDDTRESIGADEGVLGMINQYYKAQKDGMGAAVQI